MRPALSAAVSLLVAWLAQAPAAPPPAISPDEDAVRAAVQQYYDAQAARDADKAAAFWSASANPRPGRDAFLAVFGDPAEDHFVVEIRAVEIAAAEAHVRVMAVRTRLSTSDGRPISQRTTFNNSQVWRKESGGWKLLRDGPFADELADKYLGLADVDRARFLEGQGPIDMPALHYTLSQRASMAAMARDFVRSKGLFERALEVARASNNRHGEANSLHNIAQADYFLRDYPGAIDFYTKELDVARATDDQGAASSALFGLGSVAYAQAEYTPALGFYRDALAIYEKVDDGSSIGRTLVSIGNIQYLQADYDAALASYRRGLAVLVAGGNPSGATYARRGLGRVLAAQGDIAAALAMYNQVLADARAARQADARLTSEVASALESIGELYFRIGNTDRARASYDEAKQLDAGDPESAGRVLGALGLTELVAGRFDAAFANYSDSRLRFEAAKNPEGVARAWVGVGFSQSAREKFSDAIAAYRTAIGLFEKQSNNDGAARAWLGLSMAQSGAGDASAALESAGKVTAIAERLKSDDLAWRAAVRSGEALAALDKLDDARQAFERAATAIDRMAADAPTNPEVRGDLSDSAGAWTGLALTRARQGDAAAALAAMEARRAHIRRVDFAAFQADIAPGATPEERADEQALAREIVSAHAQLRAEAQAARRDAARVDRLGQLLASLAARRGDQQARLYARLPDLARWRGLPQAPLDPSAIAGLVPGSNGLLVAYLLTDDQVLIVTVARGENGPDIAATAVPINRHAFADALAAAMQPSVLHDATEWAKRAAPLAAALVEPIAARLTGRDRLVIVPDDLLWKVPFEALPVNGHDLASSASVDYATSLATLALERHLAPPASPPTPGIVAAPSIPDAVRAQLVLAQSAWQPQDAAAALAAAQTVASAYGEATPLTSAADASEPAVRALLGSADVLHVQAPLQVSGATPLLSSLILASAGDSPAADGRFEAREWFAVSGRARVVVLPDGSAFGAAGVGNAMDALAWAASAAGVSTFIVGRWPADAFAADALAAAFHQKFAAGASIADAWHVAVAAARDKAAAPAAWAGLRLIGGGS